jgi:hypothetical protein
MACHELTLEIPFSLSQQSPSSDKEVMEPTIEQENSGDTKLRVERELTDRNPLVLAVGDSGGLVYFLILE